MMTYRDESLGPESGDVTTWLYDESSGAMTNKVYADGKGPTYDYTPNGRLSRRTWARGITTDYAYDGWGNLTNVMQNAECTMQNDGGANPVNPVQESPVPPSAFAYDTDGDMTADERGWHYVWNGENRMICASNSEYVVTYAYDHRGRMVTKTLCSSAPLRLIKTTTYIWDNWNIIREIVREGDSVAVTDNVWGLDIDGTLQGAGGVGGLLAVVRDDGVFFPTYDANGNISEYVSENGEIVAHYDYSPFGEPLVASGPLAATFTHQFSTKPYCAATGFSEYQMRKYRSYIGRWMSRDSIEVFGENLYTYLGNMPITRIDILGFAGCYSQGPVEIYDRISIPFPEIGVVSHDRFSILSFKISLAPGTVPGVILVPPGGGGAIIQKSIYECMCERKTTYYSFSIECVRRRQPMRCEFDGPCGTTSADYYQYYDWAGGIVRKTVGEGGRSEIAVSTLPYKYSETDNQSCLLPCIMKCNSLNKPLPEMSMNKSCAEVARYFGK